VFLLFLFQLVSMSDDAPAGKLRYQFPYFFGGFHPVIIGMTHSAGNYFTLGKKNPRRSACGDF